MKSYTKWISILILVTACGDDSESLDATAGSDAEVSDAGSDVSPPDSGADVGSDTGVVDSTPVIEGATPTSPALGSALVVMGTELGSPTSVTLGGVAQVVAASSPTSITIDVVESETPLGEQALVVTNSFGPSAGFALTVLDALTVETAAAEGTTSVMVRLSRAPDAASVEAGDFEIPGLTVTDASVDEATVTLTTSAQTPAMDYTLTVTGITDSFGNTLSGPGTATFPGFSPDAPTITSVAPTRLVAGFSDLTIEGTNLDGGVVTIGGVEQTVTSASVSVLVVESVDATTAAGPDQAVVVTTPGGVSNEFLVNVLERFQIDSAVAPSATSVELTFNREVNAASVAPERFNIPGLTVSAATGSGATVTLTTSMQTPGAAYSVDADGLLTDSLMTPVLPDAADFLGWRLPAPTEFVVVRVGDGTEALSSAAAEVYLERRATSDGALVSTLAMPTSADGDNLPFTLAGNVIFDGSLSRSPDGSALAIQGFQSVPGTAAVQGVSDPRVVAIVRAPDFGGSPNVDTSTTLAAVFSTTAPRGAATDGTNVWVVGGFGGVHTLPIGGDTPTRVDATGPSSGRAIAIFGGNLYYASGGGSPAQLNQIGTGTPTTEDNATTAVLMTGSPYSFTGFDRDDAVAGIDTFYIANDTSGLERWELVAGAWTETATFTPPIRHATCFEDGADVVCFGTGPDQIVKVTDLGGTSAGEAMSVLVAAEANTGFRGINVVPTL